MAMVTMKNTIPYVDATPMLSDPKALREQAKRDGYLFFRGLLNPGALHNVRRQVLEVCYKHDWLDARWPLLDGIANPSLFRMESLNEEWMAFYRDVLRIRDFHGLALDPAILTVFERVFDEPALAHSRNICRVIFPRSEQYTTPPHQDYWYIGGTQDTWTLWAPLSDCPSELGGLAVLPGSHAFGVVLRHAADGAGGHGTDVPEEAVWAEGELSCGDVLMFHSLTIHQGKTNGSGNKLRISIDYRYQPLSHPIHPSSLLPHDNTSRPITWDEIYSGWSKDDPIRYYWRRQKIVLAAL